MKVLLTINTCLDCPYHAVEDDDDISSDSIAAPGYRIVCKATQMDPKQAFPVHRKCSSRCVYLARPVSAFGPQRLLPEQASIPEWCPLRSRAV